MPGWIIAAAIGSIVLTALLTFVLWRLNKPMLERHRNGDGGGGYVPAHSNHDTSDSFDGGADGGVGDGGGDETPLR
ncbi:MAG: hypothetical protein KF779_03465 [Hyphomonadaceae bacterium]|nr:hypothetical protein [Hyphomonadaceae bacterium]